MVSNSQSVLLPWWNSEFPKKPSGGSLWKGNFLSLPETTPDARTTCMPLSAEAWPLCSYPVTLKNLYIAMTNFIWGRRNDYRREWSASRLGRFTPRKEPTVYPLYIYRVGWTPEPVSTTWISENSWPYKDSNSDLTVVQPRFLIFIPDVPGGSSFTLFRLSLFIWLGSCTYLQSLTMK
jgi:hypothetical protein